MIGINDSTTNHFGSLIRSGGKYIIPQFQRDYSWEEEQWDDLWQDIDIMYDAGMVMRMPLDQISVLGRVTQGVRLINLKDDHTVATISLVDKEKEEETTEEVVENSEVINNDNSDIVELAENEIAAAEENEISEVIEEAAEENLEN